MEVSQAVGSKLRLQHFCTGLMVPLFTPTMQKITRKKPLQQLIFELP